MENIYKKYIIFNLNHLCKMIISIKIDRETCTRSIYKKKIRREKCKEAFENRRG